jgi:hypothetical protein
VAHSRHFCPFALRSIDHLNQISIVRETSGDLASRRQIIRRCHCNDLKARFNSLVHLPRTIVIKFPTREIAAAWYNSPVYREILPLRLAATEGYAVIVDGYAPAS